MAECKLNRMDLSGKVSLAALTTASPEEAEVIINVRAPQLLNNYQCVVGPVSSAFVGVVCTGRLNHDIIMDQSTLIKSGNCRWGAIVRFFTTGKAE